jgi:hypothetical protein
MDHRTRLSLAFDLKQPDRPPILGGWLAAPEHIRALTGCTDDEYWADPWSWGAQAERALGSDGVVTIFVPVSRGAYRCVDGRVLEERAGYTLESTLADIDALPEPEAVRASFDEERAYAGFVAEFRHTQARLGDLVWAPADWELNPGALAYARYGYENALELVVLHPDRWLKMMRVKAEIGRQRAVLRARAIRDGLHPLAILGGEDICTQRGPMISPALLRRHYFPLLEYMWEPLLAAGARLVWHCDGDWRPILADVLACGAGGLQGFQAECGMDLEWIAGLNTRDGDPLVIFGPMSVTRTLPYGTPQEVRAEARRAMALCRGRASLCFFTSNTITPDIPLDNVKALWDEVLASEW